MQLRRFAAAAIVCSIACALAAAQNSAFRTKATLSVDKSAYSLSSAVAISEPRKYPAGYSWVRIHFYPFRLTAEDISAARAGDVTPLDKKVNKNSYDPKVRDNSYGIIQLSVDKDLKVWQVDMSVPGHACTIAPFEKDIQSFLETYHYDGKNLRLKSKGLYVCDLKSVGAGQQTYTWDFDVSLPVFEKPTKK